MVRVDRRRFLSGGVAGAVGIRLNGHGVAVASRRREPGPPIGSGGTPMTIEELARFAREHGSGYPLMILDLAALDQNTGVVAGFAAKQGWAVRPALKTFRSPALIGYLLRRLPQPLGLVFNLREVDAIVAAAPPGTDLMGGYPPTFGELRAFLGSRPPAGQRRHRLRLLVDSEPLMGRLAALARESRRPLPLEVAIELDVGMGRGGINDPDELDACLTILRANRRRLRLGAVLGYDGHATLDGNPAYRQLVAGQAMAAYRRHLEALAELGSDLYDEARLIRNGPGSSNYRNWVGGPVNEISPGSAFVFSKYLEGGYDIEGLAPAMTMGGAVRRITGDHPSVPASGTTLPASTKEEIIVQGVGGAGEVVHPGGSSEDELSGGGDALVVPKGSVALGDYVLYRPTQAEVGFLAFDGMLAVREGRIRRRWAIQPRSGAPRPR